MSCDAAAAIFLFFASTGPVASGPTLAPAIASTPAPVSGEALFIDIVARAKALQKVVDAARVKVAAGGDLPDLGFLGSKVAELSALDMQGHLVLKERGGDSDLKCILRGISQDLTVKMADLSAARDKGPRDKALREMGYLLNDNVEVILAPPAPPV